MEILRQQDVFEKALAYDYLPMLIPKVRQVVFATDEESFEWSDRSIKYPSSLVLRGDLKGDYRFVWGIPLIDDKTLKGSKVYFSDIAYTVKTFVEKQVEMISLRDYMRVVYNNNPYVKFKWLDKDDFKLGLRFLGLDLSNERSNYDVKGASRAVVFQFQCRVLIIQTENIPLIEQVKINQYHNGSKQKALEVIYD